VLDTASLRLQLAKAARFTKPSTNGDGWVDIDPPQDLVQSVLGAAGEWNELPVLVGIANAPILRADGTVFDQAGYDPETRMYYAGRAPKLIECAGPSREDALRALDRLMAPFAEFPFSSSDQDRAVVLAYLMTLALRPILARAPLFAFTATAPGSGKGLLVEVCNLIVRGKDAAIMAPAGGRDMDEETRKRITSILLQGGSSVLIDNWTSAVGGNALNTLFTSDEWTDRVLGNSQMTTLPTRVTWAVTGNNVTVRGDMTRRSVVAELDPAVERPELRSFKVDNLPKHVLDNQCELLSALYTILRAYRLAGEPERDGPLLGRFEDWSRMVAAPIRWLGLPDPIRSQERLREDDPETRAHGALLLAWEEVFADRWVSVAELMLDRNSGAFYEAGSDELRKKNVLREALEAVADNNGNGQVNRKVLGWYLGKFASRVCEDRMIEKDATRKDRARYRVIQRLKAAA
jgi:putative DNA primase/helicase